MKITAAIFAVIVFAACEPATPVGSGDPQPQPLADASVSDHLSAPDAATQIDAEATEAALTDTTFADTEISDVTIDTNDATNADSAIHDVAALDAAGLDTESMDRTTSDLVLNPDAAQVADAGSEDRERPDATSPDRLSDTDADLVDSALGLDAGDIPSYTIDPEIARYDTEKTIWLNVDIDSAGLSAPLQFSITEVRFAGTQIGIPQGVSLDASSGAFAWSPSPSQAGTYLFMVTVLDNLGQSHLRIIEVTVNTPEICVSSSSACVFLREKWQQGTAAGNIGDWYHNSDKFHSNLNMSEFPQLDLMWTYAYMLQTAVTPDRVIVGNSSTAYTTGDTWRSNMRSIMLNAYYTGQVYQQYRNNNFYWYPEHRDHDETDYYHGKVPFTASSQGSSGSEMDEVRNFVYILAAFKPEVKAWLKTEGLLMPAVQMIFRRARVDSDAAYLSGAAHPSAFDNYDARQTMVEMANAINLDNVPPFAQIEVLSETYSSFEGKNEQWFTTPVSVCRIFRSHDYTKHIELSAANSFDLNNRSLSYHWVVLRGDPAHVRISAQDANSTSVAVEIDYHPKTTIAGETRLTNMIEVGLFVDNGDYFSAPAFMTSYTLDNETRSYDSDGNLTDIQSNDNYVHPNLQ